MSKISKPFFVLAIALFSLSGFAQDRLIRVDSAAIAWRQKDLTLSLYNKELARLLIPKNTQFGVIRVSSSYSESSLTYDSISHTLVYTEVWGSILDATRKATTIYKTVGKNRGKVVPRRRIHKYEAPRLTTRLLSITDEQSQTMKKIWTDAIQDAEDKEQSVLDGTKWVFFIGNQQAQSCEQQNALVKYVNELMDSVYNGDWDHKVVHESYKREIEWKSKDEIEQTICADTLQMKNELYSRYGDMVDYYTKSMTIGHSCLFFMFIPIGSGVSRWLIEIFKQEDDHWRLVAKGEIVIPVLSITADYDCCNNTIVFSTLNAKFDSFTGNIKSLKKMEKIGELSLSDLDSIDESVEANMQIAEIRASFPGGQEKLMSWLMQNMHYPKEMKEIQGRVLVSFYVEKDGSISDVNVERPCIKEDGTSSTVIVEQSEMSALDKEVIRVVKTMPQWKPAMLHGKPVREKHYIPLNIDPQ